MANQAYPVSENFMLYPMETTLQGSQAHWERLKSEPMRDGFGAAAAHAQPAREQIARKLVSNHEIVLKDCCNPTGRVVNAPERTLTQRELVRASLYDCKHVDDMLLESACRLMGVPSSAHLEQSAEAVQARVAAFQYLASGRIQTDANQKVDNDTGRRNPDMSPQAAAAWLDVLKELAFFPMELTHQASRSQWERLAAESMREGFGAAAAHAPQSREEIARKLVGNHEKVLKDVCNPTVHVVDKTMTLSQRELKRVPLLHCKHVDDMLLESASRLMGVPSGVRLDTAPEAVEARVAAFQYLAAGRIQTDPNQRVDNPSGRRNADMSPGAAAAWLDVLKELAFFPMELTHQASRGQWERLASESMREGFGAAAAHAPPAREEIARKLVGNHEKVLKDVCNPTVHVVDKPTPLTQRELKRVPLLHCKHVDDMLLESACRLMGVSLGVRLESSPDATQARMAAFQYLAAGRIQTDPNQRVDNPTGRRNPDMSPAAAAAWLDVLKELAGA